MLRQTIIIDFLKNHAMHLIQIFFEPDDEIIDQNAWKLCASFYSNIHRLSNGETKKKKNSAPIFPFTLFNFSTEFYAQNLL